MRQLKVLIGWDPLEVRAWRMAAASMFARSSLPLEVGPLSMERLQGAGLYTRPTEHRGEHLWDVHSDAPMSTQHAIARFFMPFLVPTGWALFTDGDVLCRWDLADLAGHADERYAVMCVKRDHVADADRKKLGQIQTSYPRKNWSSVVLWNLDHPSHQRLTLRELNERPGRDLHAFCWLKDWEIGELPAEWNHLVGVDPEPANPKLAHFTLGMPYLGAGYLDGPLAKEWIEAEDGIRLMRAG